MKTMAIGMSVSVPGRHDCKRSKLCKPAVKENGDDIDYNLIVVTSANPIYHDFHPSAIRLLSCSPDSYSVYIFRCLNFTFYIHHISQIRNTILHIAILWAVHIQF